MSTNGASIDVGATATSVGDFATLLLDINPTYTTERLPECLDPVHYNAEWYSIADDWAPRVALLRRERWTKRRQFRLHWY